MFTGLIQTVGRISCMIRQGAECRLEIEADFGPNHVFQLGESIAVNGACLSVEKFAGDCFTVYASGETMRLTTLQFLGSGSRVNLEKALTLGASMGGHMVSGHVDCVVDVVAVRQVGQSRLYRFSLPADFATQVISKGSVALDGISLTVNDCGPDFFEVNIIPQTQKDTTISAWQAGSRVNLETDIIGKYVARFLSPWAGQEEKKSAITPDFLRQYGF